MHAQKTPKKKVLVTGGAGFVGTHLVRRLAAEGHEVIVVDNYFTGSPANQVPGIEYREGHTKDIERLVPEEDLDLIYHLGEYARVEKSVEEPSVVWDLNVVGTQAVLEFWRKRKCKLIYAGSSTKFGDGGLARDTSPYAWSKAANTELVKNYSTWYGLQYAITYFYNVFGPGERSGSYGTLIAIFSDQYKKGQPLTVVSPGTQMRNFTHVSDIVDGLMLVGERGEGDEYGLGNEKSFSVIEVARLFGTDIVMLPERQGNRMGSALNTIKSNALGWRAMQKLEDELYKIVHGFRGSKPFDKRVLVLATTFHPIMGAAEEALCDLASAMPDVHFDVITAAQAKSALNVSAPFPNVTIHRVGWGTRFDKLLLPIAGYRVARALCRTHRYLFAWSLTASYQSLAGLLLKWRAKIPVVVTLADQEFTRKRSVIGWLALHVILRSFDQVFATDIYQEDIVAGIAGRARLRNSIGEGDAFANQLRFTYQSMLKKRMQQAPDKKKRVLIFSTAYYPFVGGAEVSIREITNRLSGEYEFDLITARLDRKLPRTERIGAVTVYRIGIGIPLIDKLLLPFAGAYRALRLHRKRHYVCFWCVMVTYASGAAYLANLIQLRHPVPLLLNVQEGDSPEYIRTKWAGVLQFSWRLALKRADMLTALSTYLRDLAISYGYRGPAEIIPNGASVAHFKGARIPHNGVVLITTSRLVHKNALDDVIRALPQLPNVRFRILGTGPDEAMLRALARRLGVSERVEFVGHVEHRDMPAHLHRADVFVRPSRSEGQGASFIEAMAAGLPVVATQEGGIADFLFDEKRNPDKPSTGWAVDKDSPAQIVSAVKDILEGPDHTARVVAEAQRLVSEHYDWDIIAEDMRGKVFAKLFRGAY